MFLYATIFPILLMGFLFIANKKQMCFGLGFCYLVLVISVTMPIAKRRKEIKEIQKNGICYVGNIENLVEVKVETTFNRFGHAEYDHAYCLKVVLNEKNHFVYSDVLVGRKGQKELERSKMVIEVLKKNIEIQERMERDSRLLGKKTNTKR